jgi:heat shock protein HslJ
MAQGVVVVIAILAVGALGTGSVAAGERTIEVDSQLAPCSGVGPQDCLRVRGAADQPWSLLHRPIEGFTIEPGHRYTPLVEEIVVADPPADGLSIRTVLREQIRKVAVEPPADPFAGETWRLFELQATAEAAPLLPVSLITLQLDAPAGKVTGKGGCNRYFGGVTLAGQRLTLSGIGATRMACPPPAMTEENAYFGALERVTGYAVEGDVLTLTLADGGRLRYRELLD